MFKKIITFLLLFIFINSNFFCIYANTNPLVGEKLYYYDTDNNGKIDILTLEFIENISGTPDLSKIFLYSNTGGLSSSKLDTISGNNIFSGFKISGKYLFLNLVEQDLQNINLNISNTTASHLRLKANAGNGIFSNNYSELSLGYTSSFGNYKNVEYKEIKLDNLEQENTQTGSIIDETQPENTQTGSIIDETQTENTQTGSIIVETQVENTQTGSITNEVHPENTQTGNILNSEKLNIKIIFQRPTYFKNTNFLEENICDTTKTDCRANYDVQMLENGNFNQINPSLYDCLWDFGLDEVTGEEQKCNPNTIIYPEGTFTTKLKVINKIDVNKNFEQDFLVKNTGYIEPQKTVVYVNNSSSSSSNYIYPQAKIKLQGVLTDKKIEGNNVICNTEVECSFNFSGEDSIGNGLKYYWDLGNSKTYNEKNPPAFTYKIGNYKISLKIIDEKGNQSIENYYIEVKPKNTLKNTESEQKIIKEKTENTESSKIISNIDYSKISIGKAMPNPESVDNYEWVELENNGNTDVNLDNCELYVGKKKYELNGFNIVKNSKLKIFKSQLGYNIKNTGDEISLVCNEKQVDKLIWNFKTNDNFIVSKNIVQLEKEPLLITKIDDLNNFTLILKSGEEINFKNIGIDIISGKEILDKFLQKEVSIVLDKEISGKYGNIQGYLFYENNNIVYDLLKNGMAKVDEKIDFIEKNTYLEIQNYAKINKIGIWQDTKNLKISENKQKKQYLQNLKNELKLLENDNSIENDIKVDLIEEKTENIKKYLKTNFSLNINKQKSGVKISGTFIPNTKVYFEINKVDEMGFFNNFIKSAYASNIHDIESDENGKYSILLKDVGIGKYEVLAKTNVLENQEIILNTQDELEMDESIFSENDEKNITNKNDLQTKSIISLQTKPNSNRIIFGNTIKCLDVDDCSINFTGEKSIGTKLKYVWNFGNNEISTKKNPAGIHFETGKYVVTLKVVGEKSSDISSFLVEVEGKTQNTNNETTQANNFKKSITSQVDLLNGTIPEISISKEITIYLLLFLLFLAFSYIILKEKDII